MKKKHYASKFEFPTRVVKSSQSEGHLIIGHKEARKEIEKRIGRSLHADTKISTKAGNWCFHEGVLRVRGKEKEAIET